VRVMVLGMGPLPIEDEDRLFGLGRRTWQFVQPLLDAGHEVVLITGRMADAYRGREVPDVEERSRDGWTEYSAAWHVFDREGWIREVHDRFAPDCMVGVNMPAASRAARLRVSTPLWADLNGYSMGEAQARSYVLRSEECLLAMWRELRRALAWADVFSAASRRQRHVLIGELGAVGRLSRFTMGYEFVHYVPNGIPSGRTPRRKAVVKGRLAPADAFVVLWSGGYNTWADVDTLTAALRISMESEPRLRFVSLGGAISGHDERTFDRFRTAVRSAGIEDRCVFAGWVKTPEVPLYYVDSDVGINVDKDCFETELGARNRITDMLHIGLPVVTTRGSEVAEDVEREGLGLVVPGRDPEALATGILKMRNKRLASRFRAAGRTYARGHWLYEKTVAPMLAWVGAPERAPDNVERLRTGARYVDPLEDATDLEKWEQQLKSVTADLRAIHQTRAFSLYKRLKRLIGR
jgi:glycosyltransferase involved in cell wall biosynthesis